MNWHVAAHGTKHGGSLSYLRKRHSSAATPLRCAISVFQPFLAVLTDPPPSSSRDNRIMFTLQPSQPHGWAKRPRAEPSTPATPTSDISAVLLSLNPANGGKGGLQGLAYGAPEVQKYEGAPSSGLCSPLGSEFHANVAGAWVGADVAHSELPLSGQAARPSGFSTAMLQFPAYRVPPFGGFSLSGAAMPSTSRHTDLAGGDRFTGTPAAPASAAHGAVSVEIDTSVRVAYPMPAARTAGVKKARVDSGYDGPAVPVSGYAAPARAATSQVPHPLDVLTYKYPEQAQAGYYMPAAFAMPPGMPVDNRGPLWAAFAPSFPAQRPPAPWPAPPSLQHQQGLAAVQHPHADMHGTPARSGGDGRFGSADVPPSNAKDQAVFACTAPDCGATFHRKYDLNIHQRVHSNERPFPCTMPGCKSAFKTAGACAAHVRTHTGEKPFRCPIADCHARFGQKSSCNRHVRLRHSDWTPTRTFVNNSSTRGRPTPPA